MATKVQSKTQFPGSMMDLNNGLCNGMWDSYHRERTERTPLYDPYLNRQTMNGYNKYPKEQMRQTIMKQESIFRHQLQELHRLHKKQCDLMNEFTMKRRCNSTMPENAPNLGQVSSWITKEMHGQRTVIDLELPADVAEEHVGKKPVENVHNLSASRVINLADLNEPIVGEEKSFSASLANKSSDQTQDLSARSNSSLWYLQTEPKQTYERLPIKRTIFGVELCESNHKPSFDSAQDNHNLSISSFGALRQIREDFVSDKRANFSNLIFMTNGINSSEKKNEENGLPSWLTKTKQKETTLYQMNLDSLQQNSQQFFKKAEKIQTDDSHEITKIFGVPLIKETHKKKSISKLRHQIDLNLSFDDEDEVPSSTQCIPEAVVKIASMEIDLEAPAALKTEKAYIFIDAHEELVKAAAEAIMSISVDETSQLHEEEQSADTLLTWLADVIASGESVGKDSVNNDEVRVPGGVDYFEYMTLNLQTSTEERFEYKAAEVVMEDKEEDESLLRKRVTRKGQGKRGRQRKDFQRDVLPGIVSLSRREVSEDFLTFEEAFSCIGLSWQSKRKGGGKNGRGRRQWADPCPLPPLPQPPVVAVADERSVCRQIALEEKSLGGWGKRTRRLPRQRCQNGGNHHSFALKC
ncbi:uncharacterized protein [Rutidosis leptorrhynchoides]